MREITGKDKERLAQFVGQGRRLVAQLREPSLRRTLLIAAPIAFGLLILVIVWIMSGGEVSTDNAYVKASTVSISAEVSGPIAEVLVQENRPVKKGDALFRIDARPFQLALEQSNAALAVIQADLESLKSSYREKSEQIAKAESDLAFAQKEFDRQSQLAVSKVASKSTVDEVRHNLAVAQQEIAVAQEQRAQVLTELQGDPNVDVTAHPRYRGAKAARDKAALDLDHSTVRAPYNGVVSQTPNPGYYVTAGMPVLRLVSTERIWVEANFKETQLTDVCVGQPAKVSVDTYGGKTWHGHVLSISQATGSEFSILPPQNATGNWVKVVQRIPLRVALDETEGSAALRAGMSAHVVIDTSHCP